MGWMTRARRRTLLSLLAALMALGLVGAGLAEDVASRISDLRQEALALLEQGRAEAALPVAERAADLSEKEYGADDERHAQALNTLAAVYLKLRRYSDEHSTRREVER